MSTAATLPAEDAPRPAAPAPAHAPLPAHLLPIFTIAVALSTFMEVLDTSIANVAVPTIAGNLAVSPNMGTWVISSYGLAAAIVVPLTGWIARRFGEVRTFVVSVLLFTLASALCGLATSLPMLVGFRFLQGLVSGPMVPLSQTLLLQNYPPAKRGMAMALWSMTVVVAPIFGPLLGGWITDNATWPWIFYINAPIGLFAAFTAWTLLRHRETPTAHQPIDIVGLVALFIGVGSLQLMLDNGNDLDWFNSHVIATLAVVAVVGLTFFIIWELTDGHPIVDLTLFRTRNFRFGTIAMALGYMAFFAMTVLLPLWLQTVMGYTPTWAGIATAPVGIFALIVSPLVGRNIQRFDLRVGASLAFVIFGATAYWFSTFDLDTSIGHIFLPRLVQGIAVAFFFIPINQILLSGVQPQRMAAASGLSNFFRTLSGSMGTAIVTTLWDHRTQIHEVRLAENLTTNGTASTSYLDTLAQGGVAGNAGYAQLQGVIHAQSAMIATSEVFWGIAILFALLIGFVWLTRPPFGVAGGAAGGH
ncbi:DHA2 family efflux MFS transporter permease subunit [Scleromatobacter humisilvae]|uniref:DHA2 family efflux MFS transporter permease subunit n=1 Tax=Scleromatobacter humisilvae TaxID=2897159 RepID=UPI0023D927B6|nr:DHA2 family efflux MFS transporter permease subunit [Scleromatobacter humisilvae]